MIFATANKIPVYELDSLQMLLELLKERKREFEAFASKLTDKWLRRTVLNLAQECNQYAHELWGQLETMTGRTAQYEDTASAYAPALFLQEDDVLESCLISEYKMVSAYQGIINEPVLSDNLRSLLRNHMNGLTCAFMQVKLLNAEMFNK